MCDSLNSHLVSKRKNGKARDLYHVLFYDCDPLAKKAHNPITEKRADFVPAAKLARRKGIDFILYPMWNPINPPLFEHIDGLRSVFPKPAWGKPVTAVGIAPAFAGEPGTVVATAAVSPVPASGGKSG